MARRIPSFRDRHALILHPDDHDRVALADRLTRLGLHVHCRDASLLPLPPRIDAIFFDVDSGCDAQFTALPRSLPVPLVAVIGSEAPGRLDWMLAQEPDAYLIKPIRSGGVYAALAVAFHQAEKRRELIGRIERLESRARGRQAVRAAVAQVMAQHGLPEPEAFSLLRSAAMETRLSLEALSGAILAGRIPCAQPRRA